MLLERPDSYEKFKELANLASDFVYCASTYGKIIISEYSSQIKTINPSSVGGIAGGEKYMVAGILFKFAVGEFRDRRWILQENVVLPSFTRRYRTVWRG